MPRSQYLHLRWVSILLHEVGHVLFISGLLRATDGSVQEFLGKS
jgi:hypothetical protein